MERVYHKVQRKQKIVNITYVYGTRILEPKQNEFQWSNSVNIPRT
jgi:hypothetical protein